MFEARLKFQDGATLALPVKPEETVVEAAMRQDVPLRYDCTTGECGACLGRCSQTRSISSGPAPIISAEEAAEGLVATCQTRMTADAAFSFDYPLEPTPSEPARYRAKLAAHDRLCGTVSRLLIELDDAEGFRFQPGQYLRLRPPGLRVARAYSIASTMADLPHIELLIRHLDGGQVSEWLRSAAAPGDRLVLQAPLGGFAADTSADRQVFIAGGTGLAPVLSMIRAQAEEARDMLLVFGCTREEELFYHEELSALAGRVPRLEVRIALMEGQRPGIYRGTALAALADEDFAAGHAYHLCGPPAMIDAARALLRCHSVPPQAIRAERFARGV
ncbi:hypothetical protein B5C34_06300 [Pacificimonas flava]|uniref:2-polyprenylphenol hydroxylase n=2 Tax=Pacificimonas TaxID=1960290 RepID=A0A219B4L5_9SPHN|nr:MULTISPECIES: 2Fe-2S iron-sulfur cluster binding domain-containing protein [Pacificimonas]MBZ6377164.1 2Fe-2S iron-sulfur cluster binding domain-containing protein [Pacificimonas aurantium]OWV33114.1 hypothetical protein B5C34_06300 [Pacificimonas flava]